MAESKGDFKQSQVDQKDDSSTSTKGSLALSDDASNGGAYWAFASKYSFVRGDLKEYLARGFKHTRLPETAIFKVVLLKNGEFGIVLYEADETTIRYQYKLRCLRFGMCLWGFEHVYVKKDKAGKPVGGTENHIVTLEFIC
jgi:hypothetical protein